MSNVAQINNTGVMPLLDKPLVFGTREGYKTEEEARDAWLKFPKRLEWAMQVIVDPVSYDAITYVFVRCDPEIYKTYYRVGSITSEGEVYE